MAVTAKLYDTFVSKSLNKEIDWDSDSIKIMLCTSTYTPNQATHAYKSDITNEVTGTGYTATGVALTSVTIGVTSHVWKLDAADPSWTTSTITARYAVIYDATPASDATRPLIAYIDFGADVVSTGGTFSVVFDGAGIATVTVS